MAEIPTLPQLPSRPQEKGPLSRPDIMTTVRPGMVQVATSGGSTSFTYFPASLGNDQPGCVLLTGVEIRVGTLVNVDEFQLLVKTTVDSYPEIVDDASIHKIEKTIESVYNGIHGAQSVRVESIRLVQHDPATDELRFHVLYVVCPTCHAKTKVVLTWDAVQARSCNPAPVVKMLFNKNKTECGHSYLAFLDRSLNPKGYESIDM